MASEDLTGVTCTFDSFWNLISADEMSGYFAVDWVKMG
jgi:hypothetical protein